LGDRGTGQRRLDRRRADHVGEDQGHQGPAHGRASPRGLVRREPIALDPSALSYRPDDGVAHPLRLVAGDPRGRPLPWGTRPRRRAETISSETTHRIRHMETPWALRVYEQKKLAYSGLLVGPTELGRQNEGEEGPYSRRREADRDRLVIAGLGEVSVARKHLLLEPLAGGKIRVTNLSARVAVTVADGGEIRPGGASEAAGPSGLVVGRRTIRVREIADAPSLEGLPEATRPPGSAADTPFKLSTLPLAEAGPEGEVLIRWIRATMDVIQSAAS